MPEIPGPLEAFFSYIHITGTVMATAVNIRGSIMASLEHGRHLLKENCAVHSNCFPLHRALRALLALQGVPPFMRRYSLTAGSLVTVVTLC
jgi:hypothetical protein